MMWIPKLQASCNVKSGAWVICDNSFALTKKVWELRLASHTSQLCGGVSSRVRSKVGSNQCYRRFGGGGLGLGVL